MTNLESGTSENANLFNDFEVELRAALKREIDFSSSGKITPEEFEEKVNEAVEDFKLYFPHLDDELKKILPKITEKLKSEFAEKIEEKKAERAETVVEQEPKQEEKELLSETEINQLIEQRLLEELHEYLGKNNLEQISADGLRAMFNWIMKDFAEENNLTGNPDKLFAEILENANNSGLIAEEESIYAYGKLNRRDTKNDEENPEYEVLEWKKVVEVIGKQLKVRIEEKLEEIKVELERNGSSDEAKITKSVLKGIIDEVVEDEIKKMLAEDKYSDEDKRTLNNEENKDKLKAYFMANLEGMDFVGEDGNGEPPTEPPKPPEEENEEDDEDPEKWVEKQREEFKLALIDLQSDLELEDFSDRKGSLNIEEQAIVRSKVLLIFSPFLRAVNRKLNENPGNIFFEAWKNEIMTEKDNLFNDWGVGRTEAVNEDDDVDAEETDDSNVESEAQWRSRFNKLWLTLSDTYRERASTDPSLYDLTSELNKIVEAHFSEEEKSVYRRTLLMRDVATEFAGPFKHLCLKNIEGAHKKAFLNEAKELREFMNLETEIFGVSIKEVIKVVENEAFEEVVQKRRNGDEFVWSYAANGDPEDDQRYSKEDIAAHDRGEISDEQLEKKRVLTMKELLVDRFPTLEEAPDFLLDSIIYFIIVSELRYKKFYPFYALYQNSPVNGMNAAAILPWGIPGYLSYKAVSITKIPDYQAVLMLTRYPGRKDDFPEVREEKLPDSEEVRDEFTEHGKALPITFTKNWANGRFSHHVDANGRVDGSRPLEEYVENRSWTFHSDATGDVAAKKSRFDGAIDKIKKMTTVRNVLNWLFSPDVDFGSIELNPDMQILPSTYDVIKGTWRGEKITISLDDLFEIYNEFDKFAKIVDSTPKLENPAQALSLISDMISNTSKFKVIFIKLAGPVFKDYETLVNYMYLFYIKKLFDQYITFPKAEGIRNTFKTIQQVFAEEVKGEVEADKTLPSQIRRAIVQAMDEIIKNPIIPKTKWSLIFYPQTLANDTPLFIRMQNILGTDLSDELNRWLKPASPKEKDPNK